MTAEDHTSSNQYGNQKHPCIFPLVSINAVLVFESLGPRVVSRASEEHTNTASKLYQKTKRTDEVNQEDRHVFPH